MAAVALTGGTQDIDLVTSLSPCSTPPISFDPSASSSRSFIQLGSPRPQNPSFSVVPMNAGGNNVLDPPSGTSFADYLRTWTDAHVARWLTDVKCRSRIDTFKDHDIRGDILLELDQDILIEMKITSVGERLRILRGVESLRQRCHSRGTTISTASSSLLRDSRLPRISGLYPSHSRDNSRESVHRDGSPNNKAHRRLESNRPAPLVLSPQGNADLPRAVWDSPGDSVRNTSAIRPLPRPTQDGLSAVNGAYTRPSLPPLPPPPRGQPPQPPSNLPAARSGTRNLFLPTTRSRTPNQDLLPFASSPHPLGSGAQGMLPLGSNNPSHSWSHGLPSDPRTSLKPPIRSPSPLGSQPSPRLANSTTHGRNISFGGVSSPFGYAPSTRLSSRQSTTTTTTTHPYASAQSPSLQPPAGPNAPVMSPVVETSLAASSSPGSTSPPAAPFTVGRGPFNPSAHTNTPSLDERRALVKFILPEEQRSRVVDVSSCTAGVEVMHQVLKKFSHKDDNTLLTERVVMVDDGGLCVDGWCVYDEQRGRPLTQGELLAVCHQSTGVPKDDYALTLRRSRDKAFKTPIWKDQVLDISPTAPAHTARSSPSDEKHSTSAQSPVDPTATSDLQGQKSKAIKRASTISILSGLGVRDPEKALEPPASPTEKLLKSAAAMKRPSKLRNFFGQRPPSELITTHLTEYFPFAEKKALRTARHSMMLRASTGSGGRRDSLSSLKPPLPSHFGAFQRSTSPSSTVPSKRTSVISTASGIPDRSPNLSSEGLSPGEDAPRVSVSTEDGSSVILTGDDVETLSTNDSKPHLLPPVNFSTESFAESMESLTGSNRLSRTGLDSSKRMSYMTELRSKRDRSDTASLLTVDEITAEVENRRQSMAVDMGVEGADDWTKVEPDIDDVDNLSDTSLDEEDVEEEDQSEEETRKAMTSSSGTKWIKGALIGAGSFGKVYLGMDAVNGQLMAVKQVELPTRSAPNEERKKSMLSALEREIDLLKDLQHPNIVQYLYSAVDDDCLNIFLEYVPGGSVTALLRSYGAFEEPLVKNFSRQILQGLNYLHEMGIIHRDIKGANILVDNKGGIKISDFGISKKVDGNLLTGKRLHRPSFQGSVFWMAPEVVQQKVHTTAADIWSVGCLVVEMLTGEHPWARLTQTQAIFKIGQSAKPEIPSDISSGAEDFLKKTFEIQYTCRPSAGELLEHLWLAGNKPAESPCKTTAGGSKIIPTIEVSA